jgi:hypothetical protein
MQNRILILIVMSGVSEISRKPAVGIGMTFLAGFDNSVKAYVGIDVIDLFDIVGAVAVRTPGRFEIAKSIGLPV